jgi:hypothetical protein
MKINRKELFRLYMEKVDQICEECDWITTVTPEMVVDIISGVIEKNGLPEINEIHESYKTEIDQKIVDLVEKHRTWEEVKIKADKYARWQSDKDCEENNVCDGYWFWYRLYFEEHYELTEKH